jgi:hypothetical protein
VKVMSATTRKRTVCLVVASVSLGAAATVVPGMVLRGGAAPAIPRPPTMACPAMFTTGTCLGGSFVHGEDNSGGGNDSGGGDDTSAPAPEPQSNSNGSGGGTPTPTAPPPPSPAEVQADLVQRANTYFRQPEVTVDAGLDPDVQVASTVNVATFVEVTNWQGQQVDRYDARDPGGSLWVVTITATPTLYYDPGEPGAPTIRCEDGGTQYDPDGPSAREQAARPGACAYAYQMRTGVDGRPDAWPAEVIIEWAVSWSANFPLPPDLPTSATLTESVPRQVREVSSVVVDD